MAVRPAYPVFIVIIIVLLIWQSHQSWCVLWLPPSVLLLFHTVIPLPSGSDFGVRRGGDGSCFFLTKKQLLF